MFKEFESELIEFKSKFKKESILKEIVAFLNSRGGTIYIGICDDRSVCGVENIDSIFHDLSDIIMTQIEPVPTNLIESSIEFYEGKSILKISISKGFHSLYCIKKYGFSQMGCPIRIGTTSRELPQSEIEIRYKKRFESSLDYMLKVYANYGDISFNSLQNFIFI